MSTAGATPDEEIATADAGGRHRGREVALQVLYAIDLSREKSSAEDTPEAAAATPGEVPDAEAFARVAEHFEVPGSASDFARGVVAGVSAGRAGLDERIGRHSKNWRVDRMAAVDRNVLRLATWELGALDTPVAVVIDEAVDLARRFGADTSPAFVNGILDAIAREVRGG